MRRRYFLCLTMVLCLSGALLAGPARVGMVRVEKGEVSLEGRRISTPQLLEQGQTLTLAKGARVRLQLLGGAGEVTLDGPKTVSIDRAALTSQATVVARGGIASVPDIGNTTRGATAVTREQSEFMDFRVVGPTKGADSEWVFTVDEGKKFSESMRPTIALWDVLALEIDSSKASNPPTFVSKSVASSVYYKGEGRFVVPYENLDPGTRYLLVVQLEDKPSVKLERYFERPFRLLTPDEQAYLDQAEQELRRKARESGSVKPLLELSSLFLEWDQLTEAGRAMKEAENHPNWKKLPPEIRVKADAFKQQLRRIGEIE